MVSELMVNLDTMGGSRSDSETDEEGYISSVCLVVKTRQRDIVSVRTLSTHELQSAFIRYLCVYESSFSGSIISKISEL